MHSIFVLLSWSLALAGDPAQTRGAAPVALPAEAPAPDEEVAARPTGIEGRWAILVGVEAYDPSSSLGELQHPTADVDALAEALVGSGSFRNDHVIRMTWDRKDQEGPDPTQPELRPTGVNILQQIDAVVEKPDVDTVLFYYSGHGALSAPSGPDDSRQNLILPQDAALMRGEVENAISVEKLKNRLEAGHAQRRIAILDACRGPIAQGERGLTLPPAWIEQKYVAGQGTQILFATGEGTSACECTSHGCFTEALLQGLAGDADGADAPEGKPAVRDNVLTMEELEAFTRKYLRTTKKPNCGIQVPNLQGRPTEGQIALAPVWAGPTEEELAKLPDPVTRAYLDQSLDDIVSSFEDAYQTGNLKLFRDQLFMLRRYTLSRLTSETVTPQQAALIHRLFALYAHELQRDHDETRYEIASAYQAEPGASAVKGLTLVPPSLTKQAEEASRLRPSDPERIDLPPRIVVYVDGRRSRFVYKELPALIQVRNCDGTFQGAWYKPRGEGLPAEINRNAEIGPCEARTARILTTSAVTTGVTAAGLGIAAGVLYSMQEELARTCPATGSVPCPRGSEERGEDLNDWRKRATWGAVGLVPVGLGLTVLATIHW